MQVGMMKVPTEWKVIKAMFQTTNQWFLGCFLEDALMFLMLSDSLLLLLRFCVSEKWMGKEICYFSYPKVDSWSSFSSFPIPKLQVWLFWTIPYCQSFVGLLMHYKSWYSKVWVGWGGRRFCWWFLLMNFSWLFWGPVGGMLPSIGQLGIKPDEMEKKCAAHGQKDN